MIGQIVTMAIGMCPPIGRPVVRPSTLLGTRPALFRSEGRDLMPGESNPLPHYNGRKFVLIGALIIAGTAVGSSFGGEVGASASSDWNVLPFTALAIFAYLSTRHPWAKVLALVIRVLTILGLSLCVVGVAMMAVIPEIFTQSDSEQAALMRGAVSADQWLSVVKEGGGIGLAIIIASRGFIYRVRRVIAGLLPIDPHSFVHKVAITTVVALMLIFIVPLLILSGPPALVVADTIMERLLAERGLGGLLLSDLYGLVWMIPASFLAVGCGVDRNFEEAAERLGLRLPTWRQAVVTRPRRVRLERLFLCLSSRPLPWCPCDICLDAHELRLLALPVSLPLVALAH